MYYDTTRLDRDGMELPDQSAAWEKATMAAGEMIKNLDGALKPGHDWRMEVTDEFRNPLWELNLKARKR